MKTPKSDDIQHGELIQASIDQAAADISAAPPCQWAGWIVYLLERPEECATQPDLVESDVWPKVEDALWQRQQGGLW